MTDDANLTARATSPTAPRVIRVPSPRRLVFAARYLPCALAVLIGSMAASVPGAALVASSRGPASVTVVSGRGASPAAPDDAWRDRQLIRESPWAAVPAAAPTGPWSPALARRSSDTLAASATPYGGSLPIPAVLWAAYLAAVRAAPPACHLDATLLAGIGQIESGSLWGYRLDKNHRAVPPVLGPRLDGGPYAVIRDTDHGKWDGDTSWDRAVGPMQFIPSTWATSGRDGNGDGVADPQNIEDAAVSAAFYLCAHGRDLEVPADLRAAILAYNPSEAYLSAVLSAMREISPQKSTLPVDAVVGPAVIAAPGTPAPSTTTTGTAPSTTASPTATSTGSPTASPTGSPTASPTSASPTSAVTGSPTSSTTTVVPGPSPTSAGTSQPPSTSSSSSPAPTACGTPSSPSSDASPSATPSDSVSPTSGTAVPAESPTTAPTASPTSSTGTAGPTASPTDTPSGPAASPSC